MLIRLAIAVSDKSLESHLIKRLSSTDLRVENCRPLRSSWLKIMRSGCDVIVISESQVMRPVEDGIGMLNELPEHPTTILISDNDSAEQHALLAAAGSDVVLYAGISKKAMTEAIEAAVESRRQFIQQKRVSRSGMSDPRLTDFVSDSQTMQLFMGEVEKVLASDSPILLMGETGVGKEHLAKAIHAESPRSAGPFISVNTAAMPEQLLESELFGHEQGAFTGAVRYRRGAFELAHGGTIFLDEIGEMPIHLQAKLLRVLQDYEVRPIGGENTIDVDVRVIAATNRNLDEETAGGNFRQDLFYRLSVVMLTIPPLRHRREDISTMARKFVSMFRHRIGRDVKGMSPQVIKSLCNYDWPGNVRELMNVIERAILLCKTDEITTAELPHVFQGESSPAAAPGFDLYINSGSWMEKTLPEVKKEVMDLLERHYLEMALHRTGGRIDQTARLAGIHPRGLYNTMKRLNLRKEKYKSSAGRRQMG